jgi:hypothetical protein
MFAVHEAFVRNLLARFSDITAQRVYEELCARQRAQLQRAQLQHLVAGRVLSPRAWPLHEDRHQALAPRVDVAAADRQALVIVGITASSR